MQPPNGKFSDNDYSDDTDTEKCWAPYIDKFKYDIFGGATAPSMCI
jgi:hypothetical protein